MIDVSQDQGLAVQELKGNIRVFCRVRPLLESDAAAGPTALQYPNSGQLMPA